MMRRILLASGLFLLAMGLTGCAKKTPMPDGPPQAWAEAFNARRPQDMLALYTDDCIVLPPDAVVVKGRQAVMDFYVPLMKFGITMEVTNEESERRADLALRRGAYVLKNQKGEVTERGKYLQIWRRQEKGNWLLSRDIWNTDEKRQVEPPKIIQS